MMGEISAVACALLLLGPEPPEHPSIDVVVVYTQTVAALNQPIDPVFDRVRRAVNRTNRALEASEDPWTVLPRVRIVGIRPISYVEDPNVMVTPGELLAQIRDANDPTFADARALVRRTGADALAVLFAAWTTEPQPQFEAEGRASRAVRVVDCDPNCADAVTDDCQIVVEPDQAVMVFNLSQPYTQRSVFAHELGHMLGLVHHTQPCGSTPLTGRFPFGRGALISPEGCAMPGATALTIMAVGAGPSRVQISASGAYANPRLTFDGPFGCQYTAPPDRDAARALSLVAPAVAAIRTDADFNDNGAGDSSEPPVCRAAAVAEPLDVVDLNDLAVLLSALGTDPFNPPFVPSADVIHDLRIDLLDLATVLAGMGLSCP